MVGVKTAILISEYYPKVYPEGEVASAPVGRLTPHFHDITIENLKATGSQTAGVIVGLPESPVVGLTLKNVAIEAVTGIKIAYARVLLKNVTVTAAQGQGIVIAPTATVSGK